MGKKFKKGDRVRYAYDEGTWIEFQLNSWCDGVVAKDSTDDDVLVHFTVCERLDTDEIELIEPADSKTSCLSELKGLLEKYGAVINFAINGDDNVEMDIALGQEGVVYTDICSRTFTSENIGNYDFESIYN